MPKPTLVPEGAKDSEVIWGSKNANIYVDRIPIDGGSLYLVTKMINPKKPSRGATVHACVFVPK